MATSIISDVTTDPSGTPVGGVPVTITLFRAGAPAAGFRISNQTQVTSTVTLTSNGSGAWASALEQNANIFPAGTYYVINYAFTATQGFPTDWAILVGTGNQTVGQALIVAPPSVPVPTTASIILTGNNTFTGVNEFDGNVYFKSGSPWYDVKAFGALGNGVADDQAAIQAAVNAAIITGGTVFFPWGEYKLGSAILLTRSTDGSLPVTLMGTGSGTQLTTTAAISLIRIENTGSFQTTRVGVKGFKLNLNNVASIGLDLFNASYTQVSEIEAAGVGTHIQLDATTQALTIGNQFDQIRCVFPGVALSLNKGQYNIFTNVTILEGVSGAYAVAITAGSQYIINGFFIRANKIGSTTVTAGISVTGGADHEILNGRIFDSGGRGAEVSGGLNLVDFVNVHIDGSQKEGFYTDSNLGTYRLTLTNNSAAGASLYNNLSVAGSARGNRFELVCSSTAVSSDVEELASGALNNVYEITSSTRPITLRTGSIQTGQNIGLRSGTFGTGGTSVFAVGNSTGVPSGSITGALIYASSGALVVRGSSGTVTEIGPA